MNDLADAHLLALEYLMAEKASDVFNLGNGNGFSVREVINSAGEVVGRSIPMEIAARREGDPAVLVANSEKAQKILGWKPEYTDLNRMIETAWRWHFGNPTGFAGRS